MTHTPQRPDIAAALRNLDSLPDSAYVRPAVVAALLNISLATFWRWTRSGRLPATQRLSDRVTGINVGDLRHTLKSVAAKRGDAA